MKSKLLAILSSLVFLILPATAESATRIKDVTFIRGVRSNQLVGYGLVAGLDGTGDGRRVPFTRQMLANMVNQFGISFDSRQLRAENVAAVIVTADLPPYAKEGMRIDATVSTINAKSLRGGTLMLTPLQGVDNKIYALAQGPVSIGGFENRRGRDRQGKHLAAGIVPGGALVEVEVPSTIVSDEKYLTLCLNEPDFTTSSRIMEAINLHFHQVCAEALDGGTIGVKIPSKYGKDRIKFISEMELITVETDAVAKVIINERTSTIVVGQDTVISPVAISHGDIRIIIGPPPSEEEFDDVSLIEGNAIELNGANVGEVATALNELGVNPQDMISIFQAIKRAGALQAQLELM